MDYGQLIRESWIIAIRHRYLWLLGLFAGSGGFTSGISYLPSDLSDKDLAALDNLNTDQLISFWHQHSNLLIAGIALIFLLFLVLLILSIIAEASLVAAGGRLLTNQKLNLIEALRLGKAAFWRLFGLKFFLVLLILGSVAAGIGIVVLGIDNESSQFTLITIILGVVGALALLFCTILLTIVVPYTVCFLVIDSLGIRQAIAKTWQLVRYHIIEMIIVALLLFGLGFGIGMVLLIAFFLALGLMAAVTAAGWLVHQLLGITIGVILGLVLLTCLLAAAGLFQAFTSLFLTRVFLALRSTEKIPV